MPLAECACCRCNGECGLHDGSCRGSAKGESNKRCPTCKAGYIKRKQEEAWQCAERERMEELGARQWVERERLRDELQRSEEELQKSEEEVRAKDEQIQVLMGKYEAAVQEHEAAVQEVRHSGRVVVTERGAVEMGLCPERDALLTWLANTKARKAESSDPEDGWDIISGKRKVLAVPNPDQLLAPGVEDSRHFGRFRSLPEESRLLVHSWCMRAATWSMRQLPHVREAYAHAFVLLYQGPSSPAQVQEK